MFSITSVSDAQIINNPWVWYHHHHLVLQAQISLTLFRHFSLSFIASGWSSGLHPVSSHSCWVYVRAGRPAFARPFVGVHIATIYYPWKMTNDMEPRQQVCVSWSVSAPLIANMGDLISILRMLTDLLTQTILLSGTQMMNIDLPLRSESTS